MPIRPPAPLYGPLAAKMSSVSESDQSNTVSEVIHVDPIEPDPGVIEPAGQILQAGGLVAFPTETVYGLGANALDPEAIKAVFTAKGRPTTDPLIVTSVEMQGSWLPVASWTPTLAGRPGRTISRCTRLAPSAMHHRRPAHLALPVPITLSRTH